MLPSTPKAVLVITSTTIVALPLSHTCTVGDESSVSSTPMAAGCLVRRSTGNGILLIKNSDDLLWAFPAGNVDCNEDSADTAGRETYEEAGVSVTVGESVCGVTETEFIGYCCEEDPDGQTPSPDASEIEDAQWFTRDELDRLPDSELRFPEQRGLLEDVVDGIIC